MTQQPEQLFPIDRPQTSIEAVCSIPPTGPCTPGDPNECGIEKELDITLPNLIGLFVQGQVDSFDVTWDTNISYPDQIVRMYYKINGGSDSYDSPKHAPRDDGAMSSQAGLPSDQIFDVLLRVENATHYGYWLRMQAITDPNWNSDSEILTYFGENVTHNGEVVLYTS